MDIDKKCKIESAVDVKESRPYLQHAYLDVAKSRMLATQGVILAVVPVLTTCDDVSGFVSVDSIKAARKRATRSAAVVMECRADSVTLPANGGTMPRPSAEEVGRAYPDVDRVIPDIPADATPVMRINAALLARLAEAIGTDTVDLYADPNKGGAYLVRPYQSGADNGQPFGVIMGLRD